MVKKNEIVLIRGLPGSGKSTMAKEMLGYIHFEADMYLLIDGVYVYDPSKIKDAHDWCVESAKKTLQRGQNVVISNTFIKVWELKRYVDLGFPFRIIELKTMWSNIHGVPSEKIEVMSKGWQELPLAWKTISHKRHDITPLKAERFMSDVNYAGDPTHY